MIRVNLLENKLTFKKGVAPKNKVLGIVIPPQTYAQAKRIVQDVGLIATIITCSGLSFVFVLFAGQWKNLILTQHKDQMRLIGEKLEAVSIEAAKYGNYQQELRSYEEQKRVADQRLTTVKELLEQRSAPVQILDTVGQSLPPKTWIGGLELNLANEPGSLVMSGVSYQNEEVTDFVDRLSESVNLSDVSLEEVGSRTDEKIDYKSFQISAKPKLKWLSRSLAANKPAEAPKPQPPPAEAPKGKE